MRPFHHQEYGEVFELQPSPLSLDNVRLGLLIARFLWRWPLKSLLLTGLDLPARIQIPEYFLLERQMVPVKAGRRIFIDGAFVTGKFRYAR